MQELYFELLFFFVIFFLYILDIYFQSIDKGTNMGWVNNKGANSVQKFKDGGKVKKKRTTKIKSKTSRSKSEVKGKVSDNFSKSMKFDGPMGKGKYTKSEKDGVVKTSYTSTKDGITTKEDSVNGKYKITKTKAK
tara:strand:+ start:301 stop:705 length:405 start_codon:yes stop_codon:yes gene_type:complete